MSTPNFKELLQRPTDSFERPKPLPAGTYHGMATSYKFDESKQKKTPYVRYVLAVHNAGQDIDPAEIDGLDLSKKTLNKDFYITEESTYRLNEFLQSCGINIAGRALGETIPEAVGIPLIIEVTQRPNEDGSAFFNDVNTLRGEGQ